MIHPDTLLNWCQKQVALSDKVKIQDFTSSWKNGLALCTILHHYRPDLMDISALDPENISKNNQLVGAILLKLHLPNTIDSCSHWISCIFPRHLIFAKGNLVYHLL